MNFILFVFVKNMKTLDRFYTTQLMKLDDFNTVNKENNLIYNEI